VRKFQFQGVFVSLVQGSGIGSTAEVAVDAEVSVANYANKASEGRQAPVFSRHLSLGFEKMKVRQLGKWKQGADAPVAKTRLHPSDDFLSDLRDLCGLVPSLL